MENIIKLDENKIYSLLRTSLKIPGARVDRAEFLRKELSKYCSNDIVERAINTTPARAQIDIKLIDKIADDSIKYETNQASLLSIAAGIPGGFALIGTVPSDLIQYFTHTIRILQKLIYLYGWKDIVNDKEEFDDATINLILVFMGIMFGVQSANLFINKISNELSKSVERKVFSKLIAKETINPLAIKVAKALGIKLTNELLSKSVSKIVPLISAGVSGAITYKCFKVSATRLKTHLRTLPIANPNFYNNSIYNDNRINYSQDRKVIDVNFREC